MYIVFIVRYLFSYFLIDHVSSRHRKELGKSGTFPQVEKENDTSIAETATTGRLLALILICTQERSILRPFQPFQRGSHAEIIVILIKSPVERKTRYFFLLQTSDH